MKTAGEKNNTGEPLTPAAQTFARRELNLVTQGYRHGLHRWPRIPSVKIRAIRVGLVFRRGTEMFYELNSNPRRENRRICAGTSCSAQKRVTDVLQIAISFGTMLNAINPDALLRGVNPVKNPLVANPQFAQARQIFGHPDQPPMNHLICVLSQPENPSFHPRTDGGIERRKLNGGFGSYFDAVGQVRWRGCQGLNSPARSSRRASLNSATTWAFWAVSQSSNSSTVSTESSTCFGITTVVELMGQAYRNCYWLQAQPSQHRCNEATFNLRNPHHENPITPHPTDRRHECRLEIQGDLSPPR